MLTFKTLIKLRGLKTYTIILNGSERFVVDVEFKKRDRATDAETYAVTVHWTDRKTKADMIEALTVTQTHKTNEKYYCDFFLAWECANYIYERERGNVARPAHNN